MLEASNKRFRLYLLDAHTHTYTAASNRVSFAVNRWWYSGWMAILAARDTELMCQPSARLLDFLTFWEPLSNYNYDLKYVGGKDSGQQ